MKAKLKAHARWPGRSKARRGVIFESPRPHRVSFDVGMAPARRRVDHAGPALKCSSGAARPSPTRPGASRYVDAIMSHSQHEALLELAEHATVPVINGLTRRSHPCQVMADLMTSRSIAVRLPAHVAWTATTTTAGVVGACGRNDQNSN